MPLTSDQAYDLLESAKERSRLGHAFLITGDADTGKRALATQIINLLNRKEEGGMGLFGDALPAPVIPKDGVELENMQSEFVRIVRPRSKSRLIRVEEMRELEDSFYMSAPEGQWKIGVVIDADRMNEAAANAFLKTLEEPPKNCLLLLLTTAPDRLLTTILSRCISIPLYNPERSGMNEIETQMNDLIRHSIANQTRSMPSALSLKADFDKFLKAQKELIAKKHKAGLKEEMDQLKQVADRDYLKEKEEESKAEEASEYLALRTNGVNALVSWFGDVVRWKVGQAPSRFTDSTALFSQFAGDLEIDSLLQRMEALEELRYLLTETNVSEALALETSFMNAFS